MSKTTLGLDIGSSAIKLAVVKGGRVQKLCSSVLPGNLKQEGAPASVLAEELRGLIQRERITARGCALVLPPEAAFVRRITVPWMTTKQLGVNLPFEFHDYIQKDKDLYFYDYAVVGRTTDEKGAPKELDLLATAVLKETIASYRAILRKAGLKLLVAVPQYLAYRNLITAFEAAHPDGHPREYCLTDLGYKAIRVNMYRGGVYDTSRVIEYSEQAEVPVEEAVLAAAGAAGYERVRETRGSSGPYDEAAVEIMRAVNFYGFNTPAADLRDIYFSGDPVKVEAMVHIFRDSVNLIVHSVRELLPPSDRADLAVLCAAAVAAALETDGR